eukprot:1093924-Lingulodinium_polyedra.AAC.1
MLFAWFALSTRLRMGRTQFVKVCGSKGFASTRCRHRSSLPKAGPGAAGRVLRRIGAAPKPGPA